MKRFITYLYEYSNGRKGANAGFVKLDLRGNQVRLQFHLQIKGRGTDKGSVYLVVGGQDTCGIGLGELSCRLAENNAVWNFSAANIMGSPYEINQVIGIAVRFDSGKYIASSWVDEPKEVLLTGSFSVWRNQEIKAASLPAESFAPNTGKWEVHEGSLSHTVSPQNVSKPRDEDNISVEDSVPVGEETDKEAEESKEGSASVDAERSEEQTDERQEESGKEGTSADTEPQKPSGQENVPEDVEKPKGQEKNVRRIDINDIRSLPRRNWYLCNNSFLIHGFFNYHYLILWETVQKGIPKTYLGVPGIYEQPERSMAMMFGFPGFESEENLGRPEDEAGEIVNGSFGYWLCLLDM